MKEITVRDLYKKTKDFENKDITIEGWVKGLRDSKTFGFIELNDGTFFKNVQVVFNDSISNFEEIKKLTLSSSIKVLGKFILKQFNALMMLCLGKPYTLKEILSGEIE